MACDLNFPTEWLNSKPEEPYTKFATNREVIFAMLKERTQGKPRQTSASRNAQASAASGHSLSPAQLREISDKVRAIKIFVGTDDYMVDASNSRYIARAMGVPIVEYPGGGHMLCDMVPVDFHRDLFELFASPRDST
ncbi:hypothetical protein HDU76_011574, partial [Blyttiomyces sp. JEL0837]